MEEKKNYEPYANCEISTMKNQQQELNVHNNNITLLINHRLRPRAQELKLMVAEYKQILQIRQEIGFNLLYIYNP